MCIASQLDGAYLECTAVEQRLGRVPVGCCQEQYSGTATYFSFGQASGAVQSGSAPSAGNGQDEWLRRNCGITIPTAYRYMLSTGPGYIHVKKKGDTGDRITVTRGRIHSKKPR